MSKAPVFICSPDLWKYRRGGKHPAQPDRLRRTFELLSSYGAFADPSIPVMPPREASIGELTPFHSQEYIEAVMQLSAYALNPTPPTNVVPQRFGFGAGDNPIYPGMFHAAALRVGGGLISADLLTRGEVDAVFHFTGGQHHARPARTSGFCIFNDVVLAIQKLLDQGYRVAYVDVDAHHADGVQDAFYSDSRALKISLHESGKYLYPGTGDVSELGEGMGIGFNLNLPFLPETDDETYLRAFLEVVPRAVENFHPDVLVTEFGADAHYLDRLSHLNLTTRAFVEIARTFRQLSPGKWLCVGGGGYRDSVVPRIWTLLWGEMVGRKFADDLPIEYQATYRDGSYLRDIDLARTDSLARVRDYADNCIRFVCEHSPLLH